MVVVVVGGAAAVAVLAGEGERGGDTHTGDAPRGHHTRGGGKDDCGGSNDRLPHDNDNAAVAVDPDASSGTSSTCRVQCQR